MSDHGNDAMKRSDKNKSGALTTRGIDKLAARGLSDLNQLQKKKSPEAYYLQGRVAEERCWEERRWDESQSGREEHKPFREAIGLYRQAADLGYAPSERALGWMYQCEELAYDGWDFDDDDEGLIWDEVTPRAERWYRRAAENGNALAQVQIGRAHEQKGWKQWSGGTRDESVFDVAVRWYQRSAAQGYAPGESALGHAYRYGHGVTQDRREAETWYRRAAEQGYTPAMYALGWMSQEKVIDEDIYSRPEGDWDPYYYDDGESYDDDLACLETALMWYILAEPESKTRLRIGLHSIAENRSLLAPWMTWNEREMHMACALQWHVTSCNKRITMESFLDDFCETTPLERVPYNPDLYSKLLENAKRRACEWEAKFLTKSRLPGGSGKDQLSERGTQGVLR